MKKIMHKKVTSLREKRKVVSISESAENKQCKTQVRKCFIYKVLEAERIEQELPKPNICLKKAFNSKTIEERFSFRVKGYFFITHKRFYYKVHFCHSLYISILWKSKKFSPKPNSVPMT